VRARATGNRYRVTLDVWAVGDDGLNVAMKTLFNLRNFPGTTEMVKLAGHVGADL
jgi:hypothetical protein